MLLLNYQWAFFLNQPETYPPFLKTLGPDPFSEQFNFSYLLEKIKKREINIKDFLLNQHLIAGIGNIYASEILFDTRIKPQRKSCSLNKIECEKIVESTRKILKKAIKAGGTTISDYKKLDGSEGKFKNELLVYGRESENCVTCQSSIQKIKQSNRSTFFCPNCQK